MFKHPIDARHEDWLCPRGAGRQTSYLQVISQLAIDNGPNQSLIYLSEDCDFHSYVSLPECNTLVSYFFVSNTDAIYIYPSWAISLRSSDYILLLPRLLLNSLGCLIGRVPSISIRLWLLEEYPLINKPGFINPGLTLQINQFHLHIMAAGSPFNLPRRSFCRGWVPATFWAPAQIAMDFWAWNPVVRSITGQGLNFCCFQWIFGAFFIGCVASFAG